MTDPVDDVLTDAGRRWRAAQPDPPEPDTSRWSARPVPARRWVPAIAAAVATTVAAGAVFALTHRPGRTDDAPPADSTPAAAAAALVVRDGDTVRASGTVLAPPGQPVRFCAPAPVPLAGDRCAYFVTVTGVDPQTLTQATTEPDGTRSGTAQLRGVWRSGVLTVTQQAAPLPAPPDAEPPSVPCPRPSGGWQSDPDASYADPAYAAALNDYIERQHPERFRRPWVAHPEGVRVLVVEVVSGDVDHARRELQRRYAGSLCVVARPGRPSLADQKRINDTVGTAVARLMDDRANGIYRAENDDTVRAEMIVLTPQLYDKLAAIGFAALEPDPWLRPVS